MTKSSELPTFTIYVGAMFSGKTSRMLAELDRLRYKHKKVAVFKPKMDDRFGDDEIVSHAGWRHPAIKVETGWDILGVLSDMEEPPTVVAVDEAFMIPHVSNALIWLFRNGFSVIVSSLDISATAKPFKEVEKMMPWATRIEKCAAVCVVCNRDAHYTYKKQAGGDEIEVGGAEIYESRCSSCHPLISNVEEK